MEESLNLTECVEKEFSFEKPDIRTYSPLALAYLGDGVYELLIRTVVVGKGNRSAEKLHKTVAKYVKADAQCRLYMVLMEELEEVTEEEREVMRRGRNANSHTRSKSATMSDYRKATGLEALFGYLYLDGKMERAIHLLRLAMEEAGWEV